MSQSKDSKQQHSFGCGQNGCGQNGGLCSTCEESFTASTSMNCPDQNPRCSNANPCDMCQAIAQSIAQTRRGGAVFGGKAPDVVPLQQFNIKQFGPICEDCRNPEGSNAANCPICAFFQESAETARNGDQNPDVPMSLVFQDGVGPRQGDLCALTQQSVQASLDSLRTVFLSMVLPLIPVQSQIPNSHVGPWRGCEWSSGNCWLVVILQLFQTGNWHTSINVSNPLGNALWILVHELRTRGFVPRQKLQAFRRLMAEVIGQAERGTLFENGQMDPFEVLKMLEDAGAFKYDYTLSSEFLIKGIHATPVIDLGLSPSSSRILIEKLGELDIDIQFDEKSKFSCLPSAFVIKVSSSERISGSTVDFPASSVFDLSHLTFQVTSVMLIINGHYLTVFIRLRFDLQTDTLSATYWLSDSKSDVQDCGHHVPSIVEIDQRQFDKLWENYAISITCVRIRNVVDINGNPYEFNGTDFEPLMPAFESLPQCDNGQYTTFGQSGEILIRQCMSFSEIQCARQPLQPTHCAQVSQALPSMHPKPVTVEKLTLADITICDGEWSIKRGSFFQSGTCVVSLNQYTHGNACYDQETFLTLLNILYRNYMASRR